MKTISFLICLFYFQSALGQVPSSEIPEPQIEGGRLGPAYTPIIKELQSGGLALIFRHERTEVIGIWDYEEYVTGGCQQQRNLSEAGRASSRAIGAAIRQLDIPITRVLASTYCRAADTATLAFGGVHNLTPELIGFDGASRTLEDVQSDLRRLLTREVQPDGVLVLIGHHGTIDALTTRMLDEGDSLVLRPREGDLPEIIAHIPAARWEEIARDLDRFRSEQRRAARDRTN